MPWTLEVLKHRVEVEFDPRPMGPREMGELADVLRPYFEDPQFRSIIVRGLEDQKSPPPQYLVRGLQEWAREYETKFEFRLRLGSRGTD